jgi:hypothetical protein
MVDLGAVQNILARWWVNYDEGNFKLWPDLLTDDVHFTCRSDTGTAEYEEFIRADLRGKQAVLEWQIDHRRNSPFPLRHNTTNVHVTGGTDGEATFLSYLFVTQIVDCAVANLSSGVCRGTVREEAGTVRIAELGVVLDTMSSEVFGARGRGNGS